MLTDLQKCHAIQAIIAKQFPHIESHVEDFQHCIHINMGNKKTAVWGFANDVYGCSIMDEADASNFIADYDSTVPCEASAEDLAQAIILWINSNPQHFTPTN